MENFNHENIRRLSSEIDRLDQEDRDERKKYQPSSHKSGWELKFLLACQHYKIQTVGQLVSMNSQKFKLHEGINNKCIEAITQALQNLYSITWH